MKSKYVQYYVEGEDEEKFVNVLKTDLKLIRPGKAETLNVATKDLTDARLMTLHPRTMVVLIFDTDAGNVDILNKNLELLRKCTAVSEIVLIPQVDNLEQELVYSCNIKSAKDLLGSKSEKNFKRDLRRVTNLAEKLREHQFDFKRFWCRKPSAPFQNIENMSEKIKL